MAHNSWFPRCSGPRFFYSWPVAQSVSAGFKSQQPLVNLAYIECSRLGKVGRGEHTPTLTIVFTTRGRLEGSLPRCGDCLFSEDGGPSVLTLDLALLKQPFNRDAFKASDQQHAHASRRPETVSLGGILDECLPWMDRMQPVNRCIPGVVRFHRIRVSDCWEAVN